MDTSTVARKRPPIMTKRRVPQRWRTYEDTVRYIVSQHRDVFAPESVEATAGSAKGTSGHIWNIEIIGYTSRGHKTVIFEVRRKSRNIEPEEAGGFANRIRETKSKGYFVTPLGRTLSDGAKKVAKKNKINHVQVSVTSTPENYIMKYLRDFFVGVSSSMAAWQAELAYELRDRDGNVIRAGQAR